MSHTAFEPSLLQDAIRNAPELVPVLFGDLSESEKHAYSDELIDCEVWSENPLLLTFRRMSMLSATARRPLTNTDEGER